MKENQVLLHSLFINLYKKSSFSRTVVRMHIKFIRVSTKMETTQSCFSRIGMGLNL